MSHLSENTKAFTRSGGFYCFCRMGTLVMLMILSLHAMSQGSIDSLKQVARNTSLAKSERIKAYVELSNVDDENDMEGYCLNALELLSEMDSTGSGEKSYLEFKGAILGNLGYYYRSKGLIQKAFDKYFTALKCAEKTGSRNLYADMKNNIGMLYYSQKQFRESIPFYLNAIDVYRELGLKEYEGRTLMNVAGAFQNLNNYATSLSYFRNALAMFAALKDTFFVAFAYNNLAVCYKKFNMPDSSFAYLAKGSQLFEKLGAKDELAWTYDIYGGLHTALKQYRQAEPYCLKCVSIAEERNLPSQLASCLDNLYLIHLNKGDYQMALRYFIRADSIQDSLVNNDTRLLLAKNQVQYDYSQKEELLKLDSEKKALQFREERKRNYIILCSVIAILAVSLFFGYMVYKSLKLEKQAKKTVLEQKGIIEEKQKEIIDSITYAKSLQEAILPPMALWKSQLPDSFILYKPKDIVAGDFYWMEKSQGLLFFAVADCTGHGVPGAMVSVVCSNALNRSILEFRLSDPGEILDKTRELVISTFEKSEKQVRDGMDISLCALNTQTQQLQWAGANNPLWHIREKTLTRIAPDKQPVGEHIDELPFSTHSIQLQPGDLLYLFSDGYADQFGGTKGKKFKYKQLEELIARICAQSMEEQAHTLHTSFENWKGNLEQVDDVCIVGIRI